MTLSRTQYTAFAILFVQREGISYWYSAGIFVSLAYLEHEFLSFGIRIDDSPSCMCPREDIFLDFKMIGITAHPALALVLVPLSAERPTVLLVHGPFFPTRWEPILPASVPCCWIFDIPVATGLVYHTAEEEDRAESFEGHGFGVRDVLIQRMIGSKDISAIGKLWRYAFSCLQSDMPVEKFNTDGAA